ncbi:N-acetyl sugar amidotransferase [Rhodoferax saidenbachensis]|nr:N-acetyl sugar amidotransferase [Rhodoferax saidenbachensis]
MQYCKRCLYPENHPLGITFNAQGICSGCQVHEEKDGLDWQAREAKLAVILTKYRGRNYSRHDCVVPISGGRDSFFIVHLVKKVYGLNPLLVMYNRHYNTRAGIYNVARLRTALGCDIATMTLDPRLIKRVMRASLAERGSFHWHALAGATAFPVQTAVRMHIPLVIWGAQQGLEQVGMYSHLDEVEMTRRYRKEHDLMGLEAEDLVGRQGMKERDLMPFFYPSDQQIYKHGVRGIYLGNFHRWDSKTQHENMVQLYGQYQGKLARTFDHYNDIDDMHYTGMHDILKVRKVGYGKIVDDACREIRYGRLSRDEGIALVAAHEQAVPINTTELSQFIEMSTDDILKCADRFRDQRLGKETSSYAQRLAGDVKPIADAGKNCVFASHVPDDFNGPESAEQLLTRGYLCE